MRAIIFSRLRWYQFFAMVLVGTVVLSFVSPLLSSEVIIPEKVLGQPFKQKDVAFKEVGPFIVSLCRDNQGNIWAGTEDNGVFRWSLKMIGSDEDQKTVKWTQFTGIGDGNAYAIACDRLGRVWVGTLNHGVSVFNGEKWQSYDVLDGPLGERIFAISTCPTDGDVWMATSAGLTRYSLQEDTWSYFTRADGLPEDQANALAFDALGNLYVATQCHGIAMSRASDQYKTWTVQAGPARQPLAPNGSGLPTSLINGLIVARDGTVYAATNTGLTWSKDKGTTWSYLRGRDYAAKVNGRFGGAPPTWKEASKAVLDKLLPEDYVTCLAEDDSGLLWLGFRQQGYVALDPKTRKRVFEGTKKANSLPDDYVFAILPTAESRPLIATYGGGLARAKEAIKVSGAKVAMAGPVSKGKADVAKLPSPAKPPTREQLEGLLARVQALPKTKLTAAYLGEDWMTQGDWVGRYGRQSATLCAMGAPMDHDMGWDADFEVQGMLGPHRTADDSLRHWVHSLKTDNPRSLYTPAAGVRRQSEWDDHGEEYSQSFEGPDIWVTVQVPKGVHRVSFYLMNKDGHDGSNRWRDYLLEMRGPATNFALAQKAPILNRCRVRDFWGGVYKQWLLAGPARYYMRIAKNDSFNTLLSAVMVDRVVGKAQPWDATWLPFMETVKYEQPVVPDLAEDASSTLKSAHELWQALNGVQASAGGPGFLLASRRLSYRTALAERADPALLGNWRWKISLWVNEDRQEWNVTMAKAWKVRERIKLTGQIPPSP